MRHIGGIVAAVATLVAAAVVGACAPEEPVRIGFLGGLSGRVTDLGIGGLNGTRLAVELRNKAGGIRGRPVELIEADDQQDPDVTRLSLEYLINHKVVAVIGPMTSAVAVVAVPIANREQLVLISPTVTTNELAGIDDYFFRILPATREFVRTNAEHYLKTRGLRRLRLVYDLRNRAYTESWRQDFESAFTAGGAQILAPLSFSSSDDTRFDELAKRALADNPDGLILLANSVDAAMLCQSIRRHHPSITIGTSEWAATERLTEIGGAFVEGITVAQFFNRQSPAPAYQAFRTAYQSRFGREPGYAELFAFDAANVLFAALADQRPNQSLKATLLAHAPFRGAQKLIAFDAAGDVFGRTFMVAIRNGQFVPLQAEAP